MLVCFLGTFGTPQASHLLSAPVTITQADRLLPNHTVTIFKWFVNLFRLVAAAIVENVSTLF